MYCRVRDKNLASQSRGAISCLIHIRNKIENTKAGIEKLNTEAGIEKPNTKTGIEKPNTKTGIEKIFS